MIGEFVVCSEKKKQWGLERWVINDASCGLCFKEMILQPGHQVSLHRHPIKSEVFVVANGMMIVELQDPATPKHEKSERHCGIPIKAVRFYNRELENGDRQDIQTRLHLLRRNGKVAIQRNRWHRMYCVGADPCEFLEISTFHSDDDTERWPGEGSR